MTDRPDIDARLRTLLAAKADEVQPSLNGPELRRMAETAHLGRAAHRRRGGRGRGRRRHCRGHTASRRIARTRARSGGAPEPDAVDVRASVARARTDADPLAEQQPDGAERHIGAHPSTALLERADGRRVEHRFRGSVHVGGNAVRAGIAVTGHRCNRSVAQPHVVASARTRRAPSPSGVSVHVRLRLVTAGTGLLLMSGASLACAASSSAAAPTPSSTALPSSSAAPASSAPPSAMPTAAPASPSAPVATGTATPAQGGIEVPAGNAGVRSDSGGSDVAAGLLLGAGALLVAGGSTVAIRRRS